MTRKQIRTLIFTKVNTFNTSLANVFYENLEGDATKGDTWIRASLRFGTSSPAGLSQVTDKGILFIQVFTRDNVGGAEKDGVIDELVTLFEFQTLTNSNGLIQFIGGTEAIAPSDGGYQQSQFSIPFTTYKEIA